MSKIIKILFILFTSQCDAASDKPNIVIIMADDLGWNDASFHGSSQIPTPNIDALAYNGVILNRFYTPPLCTPSRSSVMTGKWPTRLGMQHYVIPSDEPWALPKNEKLMPEYFKDAGYKTALVGKWHLGFYQKQFTPTLRGFDSHFGYLGPYIGYYDYSLVMLDRNFSRGYDMRRNLSVAYDINPKPYVTDLFTDTAVDLINSHDTRKPLFLMLNHLAPHTGNEDNPMEAPEEEIEKFSHIEDIDRRKLAAMISVMDRGIGKVVKAIKEKGIMDNTIIMFYSDNGGPTSGIHSTRASNYPLRGQKGTAWEGGCRVVACIYSPLIENPQRVSNDFMHVIDLLPTLASIANISIDKSIDGVNQWSTISRGSLSSRSEILYNIESVLNYSAIMSSGWKMMSGPGGKSYDQWMGNSGAEYVNVSFKSYLKTVIDSESAQSLPLLTPKVVKKMRSEATIKCNSNQTLIKCDSSIAPCLFNIIDDPCEFVNLAEKNPMKLHSLISLLENHIKLMIPSQRKFTDAACDPINFNNTWNWWQKNNQDDSDDKLTQNVLIYVFGICLIAFTLYLLAFLFKIVESKCK